MHSTSRHPGAGRGRYPHHHPLPSVLKRLGPGLRRGDGLYVVAAAIALLPAAAFAKAETELPVTCQPGAMRHAEFGTGPEDSMPNIYCTSTDITVTATRILQLRDKTGLSITSIDRAAIEDRQTTSVADLLATTPGITVSRNGGPGQPTAVRIRGAEDSQTLTLIDGVRVNDPASPGGAFDFGNLLTGNIERIEVLRGPNSVPWGSQAIGGVVNIVTAPAPDDLTARLSAEYGYKNSKQIVGQIGDRFGPVSISAGGGYFDDDGISAYKFGTERDGYRQYAANSRVGVEISDSVKLDLRGYFADSRVSFDGSPPPFYSLADTAQFSKTQQVFGYAGINVRTGAVAHRLAFTLSDTARDSFDPAFGPAPSFIARGRTERFEYQGDASISRAIRAVFGVEHETSRFRDDFNRTSTGLTSGYVQAIITPVDALTLTSGVRVDEHRTYGTKATFSANAAWQIGGNTILRASYGEGFKAPTLFQLFSFYGNTTLKPETAQSYEAGIEQRLADGALTLGLTAFHRDTTNQIGFDFSEARPDGFYNNVDKTRAEGIEFTFAANPTRTLNFSANYSLIDSKNRATGLPLLRRPKHSINANIDWTPRAWLHLGGDIRTVSDSRDFDFQTFDPISLDGYTLVGLRTSVSIGDRFELYARIENLLDTGYETVSGYGTYGRNAHVGVRVRI